jgi:chromosome segregation protein
VAEKEEFPPGAQALLSDQEIVGLDRSRLRGALAEGLRTGKRTQRALESLMRSHVDAVLVEDAGQLLLLLDVLTQGNLGAARVLAVQGVSVPPPSASGQGERFAPLVEAPENLRPLVDRLFAGVFLVDDLHRAGMPLPGQVFVTVEGHVLRGDGGLEVYRPDQDSSNPIALQARIDETAAMLVQEQELAEDVRARLEASQGEEARLQERLRTAREEAQTLNRELAGKEAELRNAQRDWEQGAHRLQQLSAQLKQLDETHGDADAEGRRMTEELESLRTEQTSLRSELEEMAGWADEAETKRNEAVARVTDLRIQFAEKRQHVEMLQRQQQSVKDRIRELETTIQERSEGVSTYEERVVKLQEEIAASEARIGPLEASLVEREAAVAAERESRRTRQFSMHDLEKELRQKRAVLEAQSGEASQLDVDLAQRRVRMENLTQRMTEGYHLSLPEVMEVAEPEWEENESQDWGELERAVEEMKNRLEQMGPVNMVAIEEYQEQEDRYQFLMAQQEDLTKSKDQLLETIRHINETTTEMFNETFDKVNTHFQTIFKKLFGGGEAFLELMDADDVLESGIDIVAKPPGKKPQVISLLSGGERTMTAVALLFALYSVKPSPFCILDELDAALDDANIGRFVSLVQSFLTDSQFVVITHNQKTISASDVLYGVTQEHKGVSKVVSVKLTDHDKDPEDVAKSKQPLAPA